MTDWLIARLQEPSSYAGVAAVVAAVGLHLSGADVDAIVKVVMAITGLLAVVLKEKAQ